MLKVNRHSLILDCLKEKETVSVSELCEATETSEATIRRDLSELESQGRLIKVRGGAMIPDFIQRDQAPGVRRAAKTKEKSKIADKALSLIKNGDVVYLDASTTTEALAGRPLPEQATYFTNDISIAARLVERGLSVHVIGGLLKPSTRALVGEENVANLNRLSFTIGFFGANAYDEEGFSTPDVGEASCKRVAVSRCEKAYVLADSSKAGKRSSVIFATRDECGLIDES